MADNILKLRVESSEYDAKLKKAAEGIRHLADVAHKGGGELTGLEKAELDYIRALGEMETKSRSASGQLRELSGSYKELKVVYDQLNEVEKADEGGKALAASLETLKQRAQEAKTQLDNASKSLNENGQSAQQSSGFLEALASKFTINIDALKLFDMGLKAAGAALDVAKDAFFASETNVDEWGRTIASAEGIYNSFLQSLNSGNFSDFLNNIGQVTQAARDAYNALDELGTRMTIINPERAKLQARQQELRAEIRRNGAESAVGKQALAELKKIEPLLSKSFKTESQMNYTAFEKLVRERLAEGGINLNQRSFQQFMKTFSSDAAFQQMRNNARGSITSESTGNAYNPNATVTRRRVDTRNTEQKLLDLFTDEWRQQYSSYLTASFNAQGAAASNMLGNSRYMKATGAGGTTGGTGSTKTPQTEIQQNQAKINTLQQEYVRLGDEATESSRQRQAEIQKEIQLLQQRNGLLALRGEQAMGRLLPVDTSRVAEIAKDGITGNPFLADNKAMEFTGSLKLQLDEKAMEAVDKQIKKQTKGMKGGWEDAAGAIQAVGSAMSQIEDPAAKVVGTVAQAIATIALGYAQATTQAASMGPWAWIAFAATGLATMITTISAVHSATGYAQGGMIKGNSYSGDNIGGMVDSGAGGFVGLNAGEIVLNRSQAGSIASQLQGNGFGNARLVGRLKGRDILISIDRELSATGKGQLATWK